MICGYHKYKVVWYNPPVGEDLLSKSEVGNPHCIVSCGQTAFFDFYVGTEKFLPEHKRKNGLVWPHKTT